MAAVRISPRFEVTIPVAIRESLRLVPGQEVEVIVRDNRITLIPVRTTAESTAPSEHSKEG